jgi:adenosine deaminase
MDLHGLVRALPKVSLHVHLEGSVQASTVAELAAKHGVPLPDGRSVEQLYDYASYPHIGAFLGVYDFVASVIRDPEDFHRVAYETLQTAHLHNVRHREMFFSPMAHFPSGVTYAQVADGLIAGVRDAQTDFGISCRLIADIDRSQSAEASLALVESVLEHPRDEVVGIGLDYAEAGNPPERHWRAFQLAGTAGLRRTAHTSEDDHPRNIETSLDLLGVERIDHGYHVLDDARIAQRCVDEGVVFTCTPASTAAVYFGADLPNHPIRRMFDLGIKLMIDCDDPPMFATDPTRDYEIAVDAWGWGPAELRTTVMNGIDGSWLDADTKANLKADLGAEIDALAAQLDTEPAAAV